MNSMEYNIGLFADKHCHADFNIDGGLDRGSTSLL